MRLEAFLAAVDRAGLPAFDGSRKASASGATSCWPTSTSPPPTATRGVINKVKAIRRRAYGIPTFTAVRQRVLLAWAAELFGASPRSIDKSLFHRRRQA